MEVFSLKMKKTFIILITVLLVLCTSSCSKDKAKNEYRGEIIDGANRSVKIPINDVSRIASVYAVSVPFLVALKLTDKVVAINVKSNFWNIADNNLNKAASVGRGNVDLEKLAKINPTVFIHRSNDTKTIEAVEKLNIDTICIKVENVDDIIYTLRILGDYFNVKDNANKVIEWIESKLSYIDSIVEQIPKEKRKTAILIGGEKDRVAGKDMLQTWMIEKAGGIPVVDEGMNHNWINIGIEKIFMYNPDYIFETSSTSRDYSSEELINDPAWSEVSAIKNKDLYVIPTALDSWDMPGISCILGTMYMLYKMYPTYFSLDDLHNQVDEYYKYMFDDNFDDVLNIDWSNFN